MNCCNTNDFVSATIKQSRAFATLGLLRLVTDATPLDQIITYASETNQKYFLDLNNLGSFDAKPDDVAQRSSMYVIPDGLRKMSKDYLIRKFWKNISWLMNQAQVHLIERSNPSNTYCKTSNLRMFPREVLKVLESVQLNSRMRLWDARHAIRDLYAVCTPSMFGNPSWMKMNSHNHVIPNYDQFSAMRDQHIRAVSSLYQIMMDYTFRDCNRQHIPSKEEKDILLDLISCFLVMFGPNDFYCNYAAFEIYEHCRLNEAFDKPQNSHASDIMSAVNLPPMAGMTNNCKQTRFSCMRGENLFMHNMRGLSPEAAICVNSLEHSIWMDPPWAAEDIMKMITPRPLTEVALYLMAEHTVQQRKYECIQSCLQKYAPQNPSENGIYRLTPHCEQPGRIEILCVYENLKQEGKCA